MSGMVEERLATKQGLKEVEGALQRDIKELEVTLRREIKELEYRLTIRLGGMLAAAVAIVAALVKLL
jgi:hypothetical protein